MLHTARTASDTVVYSAPGPPGQDQVSSVCVFFDQWQCHPGSDVEGLQSDAAAPAGNGGSIVPGVYVLTALTAVDGAVGTIVGNTWHQTLYFSPSSALFVSEDNANFFYTGAYRYSTDGAALSLVPTCESQGPEYRQWSLDLTFTAHPSELELFSSSLKYQATYALVR